MNKEWQTTGKVWLAGAGPGDAGLLTVKAKTLMEQADVIVYDALVSMEIISQIPESCRLIYVGKRSGSHHMPQEEINQILLKEALAGHRVLRLKGGDPFVFGRGGEELELLAAAGIPFEVVPGVTSAAAVPAYAGIPVTHRDYTSSFHIVTGHPRKDGTSRINYQALADMDATLVFLMGIAALEEICQGLIKAGMDPDTPAAIIEKGTTAAQRQVISTVGRLGPDARQAGIDTPAIILAGKVCGLGNRFAWAKARCLGGRQFLLTRPRAAGSGLAGPLRELGAQVIELPAIATRTVQPDAEFEAAMEHFAQQGTEAWLVFTSPVGVQAFFTRIRQINLDLRHLLKRKADIKFAVVGKATAAELERYGLKADVVPERFCAGALGRQLAKTADSGSEVWIMRAREGSAELLPPLKEAGLAVREIAVYETICQTHEQIREKISELYDGGAIHAVLFTSASTVHGFVKTIKSADYSQTEAVCIGEQTAEAAKNYGMRTIVSPQASLDSMIDTVIERFGN